jgi:hypothetical protein
VLVLGFSLLGSPFVLSSKVVKIQTKKFDQQVSSVKMHLPCTLEVPGVNPGWVMDYHDRILVFLVSPSRYKP